MTTADELAEALADLDRRGQEANTDELCTTGLAMERAALVAEAREDQDDDDGDGW